MRQRVTDWSCIPKHGTPCEKYNGEPDLGCIRIGRVP